MLGGECVIASPMTSANNQHAGMRPIHIGTLSFECLTFDRGSTITAAATATAAVNAVNGGKYHDLHSSHCHSQDQIVRRECDGYTSDVLHFFFPVPFLSPFSKVLGEGGSSSSSSSESSLAWGGGIQKGG